MSADQVLRLSLYLRVWKIENEERQLVKSSSPIWGKGMTRSERGRYDQLETSKEGAMPNQIIVYHATSACNFIRSKLRHVCYTHFIRTTQLLIIPINCREHCRAMQDKASKHMLT